MRLTGPHKLMHRAGAEVSQGKVLAGWDHRRGLFTGWSRLDIVPSSQKKKGIYQNNESVLASRGMASRGIDYCIVFHKNDMITNPPTKRDIEPWTM